MVVDLAVKERQAAGLSLSFHFNSIRLQQSDHNHCIIMSAVLAMTAETKNALKMTVFIIKLFVFSIQTYSLIPSSSLKSRLSSLRSKKPLLLLNTRRLGSCSLWKMFASCRLSWSPHDERWSGSTHTSSCRGLNPQQLLSKRLWI